MSSLFDFNLREIYYIITGCYLVQSKMPRSTRKEVLCSPFLKTKCFQADFPDDDQAFVIKVSRNYIHADDDDFDAYKALIVLHSGVPLDTSLTGRVGIDVIMLSDETKKYIVCVDLRGVDYGHVQLFTFEKIDGGAADIDLSILRTFALIDSAMHHVACDTTPTVVVRSGNSSALCANVVDYKGPTGKRFEWRNWKDEDCTNCNFNDEHILYGQKKLTDGELTHLCYTCYATLGCVSTEVRWQHVFGMPEKNFHVVGSDDLTPSERFLSLKNQNLKCQACRDIGCPTRMYRCTNGHCKDLFCSRCIPSAKARHTFGHIFSVSRLHIDDKIANIVY